MVAATGSRPNRINCDALMIYLLTLYGGLYISTDARKSIHPQQTKSLARKVY